MPHDRYGDAVYEIYQELDEVVAISKKERRKIILEGDFQCDEDDANRGSFMKSWAYHHRLCICNLEIEQDWRNSWTFLSSLGRERRTDYIMIDYTLHLIDARASNIFDLNSDHRAVKASFEVMPQENAQMRHKSYHNSPKKWRHQFNENREPQEYHDCLNRYFVLHEMQSLHDLEVAIQSCAQVRNTTENQTEEKSWLNSKIRHLINERRCT